jgi:OOP family OmpA-OmpF porin
MHRKPFFTAAYAFGAALLALLISGTPLAGFYGDGAEPGPPATYSEGAHPGGWSWTEPPFGECWEDPTAEQLPTCGEIRVPEQLSIKVLFEFDEFVVPDTVVNRPVLATLDSYIRKVKRSPAEEYVTIVGHTDAKGTDAYNMELGLRRAIAVRDYFIAEGYPERLLAPAESLGKRDLLPQFSPFSVEQRRVVITKVDR